MNTDKPGKRGRKAPPPGESKREKFVRLCEKRMTNAIKAVELIGNLSAPHYKWEAEDLEKMHEALQQAIDRMLSRFEAKDPGPATVFKLADQSAIHPRN